MSHFEQPIIRREYLRKVVPCWSCSRPLAIVKGRVLAAIRMIDGLERKTHVNCVGPLLDDLEARGIVTDRFDHLEEPTR